MARVGLVGGLGPESTIDYYRRIVEHAEHEVPRSAPSISHRQPRCAARAVSGGARPRCARRISPGIVATPGGGGCGLRRDHGQHAARRIRVLAGRSPVPLLSIVEACAAEAQRHGLVRLALLGHAIHDGRTVLPRRFARHGIDVITPNAAERAWVHERYVGELLNNVILDATRRQFLSLVARLRDEDGVDGVILGGTEFPLLLSGPLIANVPVLDTTALHVAAIVERLRAT